jgi:gliding motility-associated-like protein
MVTANPSPVADFFAPAIVYCQVPATVPFSSSGTTGCTVSWDFGDGNTATGAAPTHTYNSFGSYVVRMIAINSGGCPDTVMHTYQVRQTTNSSTYSGPNDICVGATGTFSNTTAGSSLPTTWFFGDGGTALGNTVSYSYGTAGSYQVKMVTTTGSCPDTAIGNCIVRPKPVPTVSMSPLVPCSAPATITFTGGAGMSGATYQWSWAQGGSATGASVTHNYTSSVVDTVKLVVTSPYGCKDSITYGPIMFRNIVVVKDSILPRQGCVPLTVSFNSSILSGTPSPGPYPSTVTSTSWDFGDGNTSTATTPTHTYTTPGTYVAQVTMTTANGCTVTDTVHIHVGTKVKPSFHVLKDSVCFGSVITAINTTSASTGVTYFYTTNTGANVGAPTTVTDIPVDSITQFWITLHSINNGCEDTTSLMDSVIVRPPKARFIDSLPCAPSTAVRFSNRSWQATSLMWSFGDGGTSTSFTPSHTYATRGTFLVRLVAYNSGSGCTDTTYKTISMTGPALSITSTDTAVCKDDMLHITGHCIPAPASVAWGVDDWIQPGFTTSHLDSVMAVGFHTITYIITDEWGCVDSLRRPYYVIVSHPTAKFGATPLVGCVPFPTAFTDSSLFTSGTAFGSRTWYFGDGTWSSSLIHPMPHTYMAGGLYSPTLVVRDFNGCADTLTRSDYVEVRKPVSVFAAIKTRGCIGEQIQFINSSYGANTMTYSWDFGDGGSSTATTPSHAYAATGSYTVRLVVTDAQLGCVDTLIRQAYITITRPQAAFTLSDSVSICLPAIILGQSTSVNASALLWNFGNGSTSLLSNPVLSFTTPGIYPVQLIAINSDGCADTSAPLLVRVLGYSGALTYTPMQGCSPLKVVFKAGITNLPNLIWDFADGSTNSIAKDSVIHVYNTPGVYLPRLIFSNNTGCRASSDGVDTIKVDGVFPDFRVKPPCVFNVVEFRDSSRGYFSPIDFWQWDFGNGAIATGPKTTRAFSVPGAYPVTLIVRNTNGCVDTLTRNVDIHPLPPILASPDTSICAPDTLGLWAKGGLTYTWSPAATLSCADCSTPAASPSLPTTYVVVGTDSNGCSNTDTVRIGIQTKTTFSVNPSGEICVGEQYQLFADGATTYYWTPSESLDNPDSKSPIARPTTTTTYTATAKEGSCETASHTVTVVVDPLPTIDAGSDQNIIAGGRAQLQATGTAVNRVEWDANPALSCLLCFDPIATPKVTTVFHITGFTNKNCKSYDSVTVYIMCDDRQLFIPNTFTPNGDGLNDYFFPRSKEINMVKVFRIFNRWGEMVYQQENMPVNEELKGWDGTYKGVKLPPDIYVYLIQGDCENGKSLLWKGNIALMR